MFTNDSYPNKSGCGEKRRWVSGITYDLCIVVGNEGCRDNVCPILLVNLVYIHLSELLRTLLGSKLRQG